MYPTGLVNAGYVAIDLPAMYIPVDVRGNDPSYFDRVVGDGGQRARLIVLESISVIMPSSSWAHGYELISVNISWTL
jgi:hypothetical protein